MADTALRQRTPRQQAIREVAVDLFFERGYHGTTLKDIADVLGMRAPSLYNHVASKQELLLEIMADDVETMLREHEAAMASTTDTVARIRRATEALVVHHCRYARESKIGQSEMAALEEPARTRLTDLRRDYTLRWEALITQAVDEGVAAAPNPALTARAVVDLGIGVARWFRDDGALTDSTMAMYYGDFALGLIGVRSGTR